MNRKKCIRSAEIRADCDVKFNKKIFSETMPQGGILWKVYGVHFRLNPKRSPTTFSKYSSLSGVLPQTPIEAPFMDPAR